MLSENIAPNSLKIICKNRYSVKCYDKANAGVCALSQWENFSWGLTYFDQFIMSMPEMMKSKYNFDSEYMRVYHQNIFKERDMHVVQNPSELN